MRRTATAAALMGIMFMSACSSEPTAPTAREQACESIVSLAPGSLEMRWALDVASDSSAYTPSQRLDAMQVVENPPTEPYTCEGETFERYVTEQEQS